MSTGKSNGKAPAQVLEVGRNGHKPLDALPGEVPLALEGDREELKTASWSVIKATSPTEEDAAPVRDRRRLARKQELAIGLLVQGKTVTDVAREVEVDRSTIHRWLNDSSFRLRLAGCREQLLNSMLDQQLLAGRMATAKLMDLIESQDERVALRAATVLYTGAQRAYNLIDLQKRIERVEQNLQMWWGKDV